MNDIQVYQVRRKEKEKERPLFTRGVEGCKQFWGFVINYSACPKQTFLTSTFLRHVMVHPVLALFRSLGRRLTLCSQTPVIFIWEYLVDEWMSTKWGGGMWTILKPCLVYYLSKKLTIFTQNYVHLEVCLFRFYMWQSRVEIEGYSVAYFDRIAVFEAPYRWYFR